MPVWHHHLPHLLNMGEVHQGDEGLGLRGHACLIDQDLPDIQVLEAGRGRTRARAEDDTVAVQLELPCPPQDLLIPAQGCRPSPRDPPTRRTPHRSFCCLPDEVLLGQHLPSLQPGVKSLDGGREGVGRLPDPVVQCDGPGGGTPVKPTAQGRAIRQLRPLPSTQRQTDRHTDRETLRGGT